MPRGSSKKIIEKDIKKDLVAKNLKEDDAFDCRKWLRCLKPRSLDAKKQRLTRVDRDQGTIYVQ